MSAWCQKQTFHGAADRSRGVYDAVAAIRLTVTALSSAGGRVTAIVLQSGIGLVADFNLRVCGRDTNALSCYNDSAAGFDLPTPSLIAYVLS
jgi:hypothetical protein